MLYWTISRTCCTNLLDVYCNDNLSAYIFFIIKIATYFRLHVCLSLCPFVRHTLRFLIPTVVSHKLISMCAEWKKCIIGLWGKASKATDIKTYISVSSPPHCWSQAGVSITKPRMCPQSGYYLVFYICIHFFRHLH